MSQPLLHLHSLLWIISTFLPCYSMPSFALSVLFGVADIDFYQDEKDKGKDTSPSETSSSSVISTVFQKSEPSSIAFVQTLSANIAHNTTPLSVIPASTTDKKSTPPYSENGLALDKDQNSLLSSVSKDRYSFPFAMSSEDRKPTSSAYQDKDKDKDNDKDKYKDKTVSSYQLSADKELPIPITSGKDSQVYTTPAKDRDLSRLSEAYPTKTSSPKDVSSLTVLYTSLTSSFTVVSSLKKDIVPSTGIPQYETNILSTVTNKHHDTTVNTQTDKPPKSMSSSAGQSQDNKSSFKENGLSKDIATKPPSTFHNTSTVLKPKGPTGPPVVVYTIVLPVPDESSSFGSRYYPAPSLSSASILYPFKPTSTALSAQGSLSKSEFPGYQVVPAPGTKPDKDFPSTTTGIIPVWTPELLGSAYGGGFIRTPSIYVTKLPYPNGPSHGLPPGYGASTKNETEVSSSKTLLPLPFDKNETKTLGILTPQSKPEKYETSKDYKPEASHTSPSLSISPNISVVRPSYTPFFSNKTSETYSAYGKDSDITSHSSTPISPPATKPVQSFLSFLNSSTAIGNAGVATLGSLPTPLKDIPSSTHATKSQVRPQGRNSLSSTSLEWYTDKSREPLGEVGPPTAAGFQPVAKSLPSKETDSADKISTEGEGDKTSRSSSFGQEAKTEMLLSDKEMSPTPLSFMMATKSDSYAHTTAEGFLNVRSSDIVSLVSGLSNASQMPEQPPLSYKPSEVQQAGSDSIPTQVTASDETSNLSDSTIPSVASKQENLQGPFGAAKATPYSLALEPTLSYGAAGSASAVTFATRVPLMADKRQAAGQLKTSINVLEGKGTEPQPSGAATTFSPHMISQPIHPLPATDTSNFDTLETHSERIPVTLPSGVQSGSSQGGSNSWTAAKATQSRGSKDKSEDKVGAETYSGTLMSTQQSLNSTPTGVASSPTNSDTVGAPQASSAGQILQDKGIEQQSQAAEAVTTGKLFDEVTSSGIAKLVGSSLMTSSSEYYANSAVATSSRDFITMSGTTRSTGSGILPEKNESQDKLGQSLETSENRSKSFDTRGSETDALQASSFNGLATKTLITGVSGSSSPMPSASSDKAGGKSATAVAGAMISTFPDVKASSSGPGNTVSTPIISDLTDAVSGSLKSVTTGSAEKIEFSSTEPGTSLRRNLGSELTTAVAVSLGNPGRYIDVTELNTVMGFQPMHEPEAGFPTAEAFNLAFATGVSQFDVHSSNVEQPFGPTGVRQSTSTNLTASGASKQTGNESVLTQFNPTAVLAFQGGAMRLSTTISAALLGLSAFFFVL